MLRYIALHYIASYCITLIHLWYFSSSAAEVFSYGGESSHVHVTRATIERIPEEDIMETEAGSVVGESSESGLESDNDMGRYK